MGVGLIEFTYSEEIHHRNDFGKLLNSRGLTGAAVEVGTHLGDFAAAILEHWVGRELFCVDPWEDGLPGYVDRLARRNRQSDYARAMDTLAIDIEAGRVKVLRMLSEQAAGQFADGSLDFIYIDGNHNRPFVDMDLEIWWKKLRRKGIFSGHDFNNEWQDQIKPAVEEFLVRKGLTEAFLVRGKIESWYVAKP